ncbi:hypothetical protein acdb102_39740 [Acidothermaceae bacterium B102]|nr:hypothetical protein acdb102_39740 [Acidothermaceae bacterium B102]
MQLFRRLGATRRALLHRGGSTLVVALIALVASAAAAVGPTYAAAARTSVLQDNLTAATPAQRGLEVVQQGDVSGDAGAVGRRVGDGVLNGAIKDAKVRAAFGTPTEALEATAVIAGTQDAVPLDSRDGVCAQLTLASGRCPEGAADVNKVMASESLMALREWHVGQVVAFTGWPSQTIVGVYRAPKTESGYWFGREPSYFTIEFPASIYSKQPPAPADALFTVPQTMQQSQDSPQGLVLLDYPLVPGLVTVAAAPGLGRDIDAMSNAPALQAVGAVVRTSLPGLITDIQRSWTFLAVPVLLATVQLLALIWLLLFLVVTDTVEARSAEIALAKLRGYGGRRLLGFALTEPLTLLILALPAGVLVGWGLSVWFSHSLLRPGTHVGLPGPAWGAAALATLGGMAAVAVAARRVLTRPIVEQWRRAGRRATDRSWVFDSIVLTGAVAGLVQLKAAGGFTSVRQSSVGLLVPGLLGLAVAVISSRLLPLVCRRLFGATRRRGGTSAFLAVRFIARRPGGTRTTMILATAFALATFGTAAWANGAGNRTLLAQVQTGAPAVLDVAPTATTNLAAVVDKLDPSGTRATAVDSYFDASGTDTVVLGVEPARFAEIAYWRTRFAGKTLAELTAQLTTTVAPDVQLNGDALRLRIDVGTLPPTGVDVGAQVDAVDESSAIDVDLGTITQTGVQTTKPVEIVGCNPCQLRNLSVNLPTKSIASASTAARGDLTVTGIDVRRDGQWQPVTAGLTTAASWRTSGVPPTAGPEGLHWRYAFPAGGSASLSVADLPLRVPAIVAFPTFKGPDSTINGFNAQPLQITAIGVADALPSVPVAGFAVDRTYAERAAHGYLALVSQQVWTTKAAEHDIAAGLDKAGVKVLGVTRASDQQQLLDRQGPALASVLFLADSISAASLAATAAVLGLVVAARRRRYEFAALSSTGVTRRELYGALLVEQSTVLVFGALAGVAAGLAAAVLSLQNVPQLVVVTTFPPLSYALDRPLLAAAIAAAVVVLLVIAAVASRVLLAGAHAEQLREGDI